MPPVIGYSDRVNHAFAFAAKHHDRQVRRGTALPYLTHPANVAVILTRYGCDEDTVVAGILFDVVSDWVRDGRSRDELEERIGAKFGVVALATVLQVCERTADDASVEMSAEERKKDRIVRLGTASEAARWLCTADTLHNAGALLADLKRTAFPETVWGRFNRSPEAAVAAYRHVYERLRQVGFRAPILDELRGVVDALEHVAASAPVAARP